MLCNGSCTPSPRRATSSLPRPSEKKNLGRRARNWLPRSPRRRRQFVRRRGSGRHTMDSCRQPAWRPPPGRSDRRGRALRALGARDFPSTTLQAFGSHTLCYTCLKWVWVAHALTGPPSDSAQRCRRFKSNALLTAWRPHAATLALEREPSRLWALQGHSYTRIRLLDALRRSYSPTVRCGKISRPAVADVSGGRFVGYVCRD